MKRFPSFEYCVRVATKGIRDREERERRRDIIAYSYNFIKRGCSGATAIQVISTAFLINDCE